MAYTTPPAFAHGDYPTAANLNTLSDDIAALYGRLGDMNVPSPTLNGDAVFLNVHRWLHYQTYGSNSAIIDGAGVGDDYSLPESTGAVGVYDLSSVDWMAPGRYYRVSNCRYALEDKEP